MLLSNWLNTVKNRLWGRNTRRCCGGRRDRSRRGPHVGLTALWACPAQVELLEERTLLSSITVNTIDDVVDGDTSSIGNLIASPGDDGVISLREAIDAANATDGADTVVFDTSTTFATPQTITLGGTQLVISDALTITGPGADQLTIDAARSSRIFSVDDGDDDGSDTDVWIAGLMLTGGDAGDGGAIWNTERLTLTYSTISGNTAGDGGGIANSGGNLTVSDSTISDNTAGWGWGGGIENDGGEATVDHSTITGNSAEYGGGISNYGGQVTISDSTISDNYAYYDGGGIDNWSGQLSVTNSTISGNDAEVGGGVSNDGGDVTVSQSTISGNGAEEGGGIANYDGDVTVSQSIVSDNSALFFGGGISVYEEDGNASLTVQSSTVSGNTASRGGGIGNLGGHVEITDGSMILGNEARFEGLGGAGIGGGVLSTGGDFLGRTLVVSDSTISGNTADVAGGGVAIFDDAFYLTDSVMSDNTAAVGGGMANVFGHVEVTGSTISGNSAVRSDLPEFLGPFSVFDGSGGGIFNFEDRVVVTHTTVTGNSAAYGGGFSNDRYYDDDDEAYYGDFELANTIVAGNTAREEGNDVLGPFDSNGHNLIGDGQTAEGFFGPGDLIGFDPLLGPLANNGGPTLTHSLLPGSPAIDAGENFWAVHPSDPYGEPDPPTPLATDQRGYDRIVDGGVYGVRVDIGATEFGATGLPSLALEATETMTVLEGDTGSTDIVLTVSRSDNATDVTVDLTVSGVVSVGTDLQVTPPTVQFAAGGALSQTVTLSILGDTELEPDESFLVSLSNPTDATLSNMSQVAGTIVDDEATLLVTTLIDEDDGTVDPEAGEGNGTSLREALAAANDTFNRDVIRFDPSLTQGGPNTIVLESGGLTIASDVRVLGPGSDLLTIDAEYNSGIFFVDDHSPFQSDAWIAGLTLTGGGQKEGGAIWTSERLTVYRSTISGNDAFEGGGIANDYGDLTVSHSTISGNTAVHGGGVSSYGGDVTVSHSTISGNEADRYGGGIAVYTYDGDASVIVRNSTIRGNTADSGGGISVYAYYGDAALTVQSSTISGNAAVRGGGIDNVAGHVEITDGSMILGNRARFDDGFDGPWAGLGGGVFSTSYHYDDDTLIVSDSTISRNTADVAGGGVATDDDTFYLTNSVVSDNTAAVGGGIANLFGHAEVTRSTISGNTAVWSEWLDEDFRPRDGVDFPDFNGDGGGIFTYASDCCYDFTLLVNESTISDNAASHDGGGIFNANDHVEVFGSTISGNRAGDDGGGVANVFGHTQVTGSTISGNDADEDGGGIFNDDGDVTVSQSTVTGNSAAFGGGFANRGFFAVANTIVAGNSARRRGEGDDVIGRFESYGHNLIGDDGEDADDFDSPGDLVGVDPRLGPLANNGGPTLTHAVLPGSPAIDAGENFWAVYPWDPDGKLGSPTPLRTDQRGYDRVVDGASHGLFVDIGATEFGAAGLPSLAFEVTDSLAVLEGDTGSTDIVLTVSRSDNASDVTVDLAVNGVASLGADLQLTSSTVQFAAGGVLSQTVTLSILGDTVLEPDESYIVSLSNPTGATLSNASQVVGVIADDDNVTLLVTTLMDEDDGTADPGVGDGTSLREALAAANEDPDVDVIRFDASLTEGGPGTIVLENGELTIATDVRVVGPGSDLLTIDRDGSSRIFFVDDDNWWNQSDVWIAGLTLTGGSAEFGGAIANTERLTVTHSTISGNDAEVGGGIFNYEGDVTVSHSTITGNSAEYGGGISNYGGQVTISHSTISDNDAYYGGGGIANYGGDVTVSHSTISGNTAHSGGGIENDEGSVTISHSTISDNDTIYYGGGGIANDDGDVTVSYSTISDNVAGWGRGGGIENDGGEVTVGHSTISGNYAYDGGGIANDDGNVTVSHSTISDNSAYYDGGGIDNWKGELSVTNSTISGNDTDSKGGGIFNYYGAVTVTQSTVSENSAEYGGGFANDDGGFAMANTIVAGNTAFEEGDDVIGRFESYGHNLIGDDGEDADDFDEPGDLIGVDPMLSPLADNGGPTLTHALLPGSPAIDAGDNTAATEAGLTTDQRGMPRFFNETVDIGAYELIFATTTADVVDGDTSSMSALANDPGADGAFSLRELIIAANNTPGSEVIQLLSGTYTLTLRGSDEDASAIGDLDITDISGSLRIQGADAETTVIDASALGDRVFHILADAEAEFAGVTITGGNVAGASPEAVGGGILNSVGTLTVTNSTISDNSADYGGGGIGNMAGSLTINNSTISGNTVPVSGESFAYGGGGLLSFYGELSVTNSTISGNSVSAESDAYVLGGGGIFSFGELSVTNSTISGNAISGDASLYLFGGGGILSFGELSVANSTISGNAISGDASPYLFGGGGILSVGELSVANSTISENSISGGASGYLNGGGGILSAGDLAIANSTVSGNSAGELNGGGIFTYGTGPITNSTISGNSAAEGGGIWNDATSDLVINNTIITNSTGGDVAGVAPTAAANNLIDDDVADWGRLAAVTHFDTVLRDNGGPTLTHALLPGSNAIDAGGNTAATEASLTTDQRGVDRFLDGDGDTGFVADVGAVESIPDADGLDETIEDAAPNGGDGNNDGIPDSQQSNVTSLPNAVNGQYVTLVTTTDFSNVMAIPNPSPADTPDSHFPVGFLSYEINNVIPGGATTVTIIAPAGTSFETYFKYGPTPDNPVGHWYEFLFDGQTGAEFDGNTITLHFVDGQRGDDDLTANGVIVDPSAPASAGTLTLSIAADSVAENAGTDATTVTVTRGNTSDLSDPLVVTLTNGDDTEIAIPSSVTILANEASATFDIDAVDDTLLDGTQTVTITASADRYVSGDDTLDVTDHNALPVVESVTASPDPVVQPNNVTLTANGVTDSDGTVQKVEFYRDSNQNGTLEPESDQLLGTDMSSSGGWTWIGFSSSFSPGPNRYFVRVRDTEGAWSSPVSTTGEVVPPTPVIIDNGDAGFALLGFTGYHGQGYQDDMHFSAAGSGADWAQWDFTDLVPGAQYEVAATWSIHPNRATDAPFFVNGTLAERVNQELAPDDFADAGANWERLGTFAADSSGELTVRLTDAANEYVIADAVRVIAARDYMDDEDTVGFYHTADATFHLRDTNQADGTTEYRYQYGPVGDEWVPLAGDWDGDGTDTIGLYDPVNSIFFLRNSHAGGPADMMFGYGPGGLGWLPISGDWDGDGTDTIGLYDPVNSIFFLRNSHAGGPADMMFGYGPGGLGWLPISGDWDGDGADTVGLYEPAIGVFFLRNSNKPGIADAMFGYGPGSSGWQTAVGDWNGDGVDTVGLYDPAIGNFYLKNTNAGGVADVVFGYGPGGQDWLPLVGSWDGGSAAALRLALPASVAESIPEVLTTDELSPVVETAIGLWATTGISDSDVSRLESIAVSIADLSGSTLALTTTGSIVIDIDAAGYGWYTEDLNSEFGIQNSEVAESRVDLLTVVSHELGHVLGLGHDASDDVMEPLLPLGVRRLPGPEEIDVAFASGWDEYLSL